VNHADIALRLDAMNDAPNLPLRPIDQPGRLDLRALLSHDSSQDTKHVPFSL
jgi:hypothetical protein